MAATNKCLAQSNKSRTGDKATKKRIPPISGFGGALMGHDASGSQIDRWSAFA